MRPFLPALLAGALARGNDGIDFGGTDYKFLESVPFLIVVLVLAIAAFALRDRRPVEIATAVAGLALGALLFAGALADHHHRHSALGLVAGAACAALGWLAVAALFGRARRRLAGQGGAAALLDAYAEAIALALAAIAIVVPVVSYAALVAFAFLVARARGERDQKFQGLRILR